jgi:uncharacterized protein involved in exopolysaccharide biosynthesis
MPGNIIAQMASSGRENVRRSQAPAVPTAVLPSDPKVVGFLENYAALERERDEVSARAERLASDLALGERRLAFLEQKLAEETVKREQYERGYLSLKCQLAIAGNVVIAALEESKRDMLRAGLDPDKQAPETAARVDEEFKALAAKFAPRDGEATDDKTEPSPSP